MNGKSNNVTTDFASELLGYIMYDFAEQDFLSEKGRKSLFSIEKIQDTTDIFQSNISAFKLEIIAIVNLYFSIGYPKDSYDNTVVALTYRLVKHVLEIFNKHEFLNESAITLMEQLKNNGSLNTEQYRSLSDFIVIDLRELILET